MKNLLISLALDWAAAQGQIIPSLDTKSYCETRDIFQERLDKMTHFFVQQKVLPEADIYLIAAIVGEIGNNSFDHNLGSWPDLTGIFFDYDTTARCVVLADRGQGVLTTLKKVRPGLQNDLEAVETAFKERLSGRSPENRGNGLKFVRQTVHDQKLHLTFLSGSAKAVLNDTLLVEKSDTPLRGCLAILEY